MAKIIAYEIWKGGKRDSDALTYQDLTVADCADGYEARPLVYLTGCESLRAELEAVKAKNERLAAEKDAAEFAARHGESLSSDAIHEIRELLKAHDVPLAPFIDDHVRNAIVQRNQERDRAEAAELRAAQLEAENGRLREDALEATRKCMSAWAAGEPAHRVKDMIDAVERLQSLVDPLHGAALIGREG